MTELLQKVKERKIHKSDPWEGDVLERRKIADFLTGLLSSSTNGFVLNIDSPWGTGKTFFLDRWMTSLESKHPCIHFNAWKSDHNDDALIAFISEIGDQLFQKSKGKKVPAKVGELIGVGGKIAIKSLPLLTKAAIRYGLGDEGIEEFKELFNKKTEDDIAKQVDSWTANAVADHLKKQQTIDEFKILLENTVSLFAKENKLEIPLYIFIDELDRCRPTYAIELLEKIKHLFDVPGVVFVVATDTEQLSHSIRSVYGHDFEADIYLRRFFDQTYRLPLPSFKAFAELLQKEYKIISPATVEKIKPYSFESIHDNFAGFAEVFGLNLRDQQRCFLRLRAAIMASQDIKIFHFSYLCFLAFSQIYDPKQYKAFDEGKINGAALFTTVSNGLGPPAKNSIAMQLSKEYFHHIKQDAIRDRMTTLQTARAASPQDQARINSMYEIMIDLLKDFSGFQKHKEVVKLAGDLA